MIDLAKSGGPLKLNLACGQRSYEGFDGVDVVPGPGVQHVLDLLSFPWPWPDSSVDAILCEHFIEHIPHLWLAADGKTEKRRATEAGDRPLFFAFFDECYRILKPGGKITIVAPNARSNRAFQDPTHERFIVQETFAYLGKAWREREKLDHYPVKCDFEGTVEAMAPVGEELYAREVVAKRYNHYWNVVHDWRATLTAMKGQKALPKALTAPLEAIGPKPK